MGKRRFALLLILLLSVPSLQGQVTKPAPVAGQNAVYAESSDGLRQMVLDILKAKKAGDDAAFGKLLSSLVLPNHEAWMIATFGEPMGKRIALLYGERSSQLTGQLTSAFAAVLDEALTIVEIDSRDEPKVRLPGEGNAPGIVLNKQRPARLYEVRFHSLDRQKSKHMWHFAYVDGGFRYLGHLRPAPEDDFSGGVVGGLPGGVPADTNLSAPPPSPPPKALPVGDNVMRAQLIKMVMPKYSPLAAQAHLTGSVLFHVILAKDGTVTQIDIVSGHPLLVQAALDAVKQWQYEPTLLNGEAVEVDTTVTVNFQLDKKPSKDGADSNTNSVEAPAPAPPSDQDAAKPVRVPGKVQQTRLIRAVKPVYPDLARQARIQGVVRLKAIIAKDGTVHDVEVVSGHAQLVQAAVDAVRKWRYQPTLLNGLPVEVLTTIDVVFYLN